MHVNANKNKENIKATTTKNSMKTQPYCDEFYANKTKKNCTPCTLLN